MDQMNPFPGLNATALPRTALAGMAVDSTRPASVTPLSPRELRKILSFFTVSVVLLGIYSFYFLFPQGKAYLTAGSRIQAHQAESARYQQDVLPALEAERDLHQAAFDKEFSERTQRVSDVLPRGENRRDIIRTLEEFATNLGLELNSLNFGQPYEEGGVMLTPVSINIPAASQEQFAKLLDLIKYSGFTEQTPRVRLMRLGTINVREKGTDSLTGRDTGLGFSMQMEFYWKKSDAA